MTIDPTFSAAVQLRKWYDTEPHPDSFGSRCNENVSARHLNDSLPNDIIFIADVYESDMGSQTPQTFTIRAMVRLIYSEKIDDIVYPACRNCSRRVTLVDGIWQCGKCKEDFARLEYRWGHTHTHKYMCFLQHRLGETSAINSTWKWRTCRERWPFRASII